MIREVDGEYVISSGGRWLPGAYVDERAARYAFRLTDRQLHDLNETRGRGADYRPISFDDLRSWRKLHSDSDQEPAR
jgi:hypothetical protein